MQPLGPLRPSRIIGATAACLVAMELVAAAAMQPLPPLTARFEVRFEGRSTLHGFEGSAAPGKVDLEPAADSTDATPVFRGEATIAVASLVTGNESRDAKMRAMLDGEHYPEIRASFARIDVSTLRAGVATGNGELPLRLTIRDVTRDLVAKVSEWEEVDDHASFDAHFRVSLEQFGLVAPSVFGLIRVADEIDVHVRAIVGARSTAAKSGVP